MTKKELVNRWLGKDGNSLLEEIINNIRCGEPLTSIRGLEKHAGRWDLRGAILSSLTSEKEIRSGRHSFVKKKGSLSLKKAVIENIDFSFADISYAELIKCVIKDCLFESTILKEITITACDIKDCIFRKADLSYSFLNLNIGANSGSFINCIFSQINFTEAIFNFPIIKNCTFENCKLVVTVFDGSRFEDCKFIGVLESPLFMGYSVYATKSILGIFNRVDPHDYPNEMRNVDFLEAKLVGASFTHDINLDKCKLPVGDEYIIIKNLESTMEAARKVIETDWQGEEKRLGLGVIDKIYFKEGKHGKGKSIINMTPVNSSNLEFEKKFYSLIKRFNQ